MQRSRLAGLLGGFAIACGCGPAAWGAAPEVAQDIGRRYALVIGNAAYQGIPALKNPVNDSKALCAALGALRFETDCRQDLPDRRSLRDAVRNFTKKLKPEDVALFYFAGHGVEIDGENYLIPTAADVPSKSYMEDEALRLGFVFDELREAKVRLAILILDACRDNPFGKVRSTAGGGLSAPAAVPAGSILIFPTAPGKVASDGSGGNGLFTSHLLRHVNSPGITIEEMFKRVIGGVRVESVRYGQEQVPWMNMSFTGEFCFVGCGTRVSTEQYLALVQEKRQVEQITLELQGKLTERQNEVAAFRQRMQEMEVRLNRQGQDTTLSQAQQQALAADRQEHASKTVRLQQQEAELARLHSELDRLRRDQADYQRRESEMALASGRIAELERQLSQQEERGLTLAAAEVAGLRKERAELLRRQENNETLRGELSEARQKLGRLQDALAIVDKQRHELDEYKARITRLETETHKKEAALSAMRGDLEAREKELAAVRTRLAALQNQMQSRTQDSKISESAMAKLREERDALVKSSRLLADRDHELRQAREQLQRLESMQAETAQRERDIARSAERIGALEAQLSQAHASHLSATELTSLRRERDELQSRNEALRTQLRIDQGAQLEVEELRRRLLKYDQQQAELRIYKDRLTEAERQLKDAAAAAVKGAAFVSPAL